MRGTWQTTDGGGGSGIAAAVLVVVAAALAVKLAGPVLAAVAELVYMLLIVVAVTDGAGAIGLVGLLIWRWRRTHKDTARARPSLHGALYPLQGVTRAAQPLPQPRPAIDRAPDIHLHLHGVSADDVAAIIRQQQPAARPAIEED